MIFKKAVPSTVIYGALRDSIVTTTNAPYDVTYGYSFQVTEQCKFKGLALRSPSYNHYVAFWNADTGGLYAALQLTTVQENGTNVSRAYAPAPITLLPGSKYTAGIFINSGIPLYDDESGTVETDPLITNVSGSLEHANTYARPDTASNGHIHTSLKVILEKTTYQQQTLPPEPTIATGSKMFLVSPDKSWMPGDIKEWDLQYAISSDNVIFGEWKTVGTFGVQTNEAQIDDPSTEPIESDMMVAQSYRHELMSLTDPLPYVAYRYRIRTQTQQSDWSEIGNAGRVRNPVAGVDIELPLPDQSVGQAQLTTNPPAVGSSNIQTGAIQATHILAGTIQGSHIAAGTLTAVNIQAGTITANEIASHTITADQIAAGVITATEISAHSITAEQIAANTITANEIAAHTITADQIAADTITANELAAGSVTAGEILAGTITAAEIAANTITADNIAANTITANELAANSVTADELAANSVTAADIQANTITSTQIAANTITATEIAADAITTSELAAGAVYAENIQSNTITASQIAANTITATEIAANAITTDELNAQAVTSAKIYAGAVEANKIQANNIAAGVITATLIAANTITASQIAANTITANEIAADAITADELAANAVTASEINAQAVTSAKIYSGAVEADKIQANNIASGIITSAHIAANTITAADIEAGTITATQIATGTITATQIATGTITATQIASGTITADKLLVGVGGGNVLSNSRADNGTTGVIIDHGSGLTTVTPGRSGAHAFRADGAADLWVQFCMNYPLAEMAPVAPGEKWTVSGYAKSGDINPRVEGMWAGIAFYTAGGTWVSDSWEDQGSPKNPTTNPDTWARGWHTATVPANAAFAQARFYYEAFEGEHVWLTDAQLQQGDMPTGYTPRNDEIPPGSITAVEIAAGTITGSLIAAGTITATNIQSGTITGALIASGTITGDRLVTDTITATQIAAGTITGSELTATAIDAMTITGATFRTSASNPRVYLDSTGIGAVDASGVTTFKADASTGKITTLAGIGGGNFVRNSSFEDSSLPGLEPWGGGYSVISSIESGSLGAIPHGTHVLKLEHTAGDYSGVFDRTNRWAVEEGQEWIISAYVRPSFTGNVIIGFQGFNSSNELVAQPGTDISCNANVWTRISYSWVVTSGITSLGWAVMRSSTQVGELIYIDAVQAEKGTILTAYGPKPDEILPGAITIGGSNLLTDSSFEKNIIPDWFHYLEGDIGTGEWVRDTAAKRPSALGSYGGRVKRLTGNNAHVGLGQSCGYLGTATYDRVYTMSAWVKPNASTTMTLYMDWNLGGYGAAYETFSVGTEWQRINFTFTLPANAAPSALYVWWATANPNNEFYVDDMQLEEGEFLTAYAPKTDEILPGTVTGGNAGAASMIAAGTIIGTDLVSDTITAREINSGSITSVEIAANTITSGNILAGTIEASDIHSGTITATEIATGTITGDRIASTTITASNIASNTITASQINTDAITSDELAANSVSATEIQTDAVTAAKIQAGAVTASKLNVILGGGNLLPHSSFEGDTVAQMPWGADASPGGNFNTYVGVTTGWARHGTKSIRLAGTSGTGGYIISNPGEISRYAPVRVGVTYAYRMAAKIVTRPGTSSVLSFNILYLDSGGNFIGESGLLDSRAATVGEHDLTYAFAIPSSPAGIVYVAPRFYMTSVSNSVAFDVYFDAFQVEEGEVATPYTPKVDEILPGTITADHIVSTLDITGKTITGGTIQTAVPNNDRVVLDGATSSLKVYDGTVERVVLDGTSGLTLKKTNGTAGLYLSANGGLTTQQAESGSRITLDSTGLKAYAGAVNTVLLSSGGLFGIVSAATGARMELNTFTGFNLYNASEVNTVQLSADGAFRLTSNSSGARVELDAAGLNIYTASVNTVSLTSAGNFTLQSATSGARVSLTNSGLNLYDASVNTVSLANSGTFTLQSATSGARLVLTNTGLNLYDASVNTVSLTSAGNFTLQSGASGSRLELTNSAFNIYNGAINTVSLTNAGAFTLRSNTSGARVELDTSGLRMYNASANLVDLNANGSFLIRSAGSGSRIEISGSGLSAYSGTTQTFNLDAATGNLKAGIGSQNMLKNSMFENWVSGDSPIKWQHYDNGGTGTHTWSKVADGGPSTLGKATNSWRLQSSNRTANKGFMTSTQYVIKPNTFYVQSWWWKGDSYPDYASNIAWASADFIENPAPSSTVWQRYSKRLLAPAGGGTDYIFIYAINTSFDVQIAQVQFEEGLVPTGYTPRPDEMISGEITGGTITGSTIQTAATGVNPAVRLTSSGITQTNSSGTPTLIIPSDGTQASLVGKLDARGGVTVQGISSPPFTAGSKIAWVDPSDQAEITSLITTTAGYVNQTSGGALRAIATEPLSYRDLILSHGGLTHYWRMGSEYATDQKGSLTMTIPFSNFDVVTGLIAGTSTASKTYTESAGIGVRYCEGTPGSSENATNAFTVEYWISFSTAPGTNVPVIVRTGGGWWWSSTINTDRTVSFRAKIDGTDRTITSSVALSTGTRYYITHTYDGTTMKTYIDGSLDTNTGSYSGNFSTQGAASYLVGDPVGGWNIYADPSQFCILDEVAVYNGNCLSDTIIADHYDTGDQGTSSTMAYEQSIILTSNGASSYAMDFLPGAVGGTGASVHQHRIQNATYVDFSGLDGDNEMVYEIICGGIFNANSGDRIIRMRPNNDDQSNYSGHVHYYGWWNGGAQHSVGDYGSGTGLVCGEIANTAATETHFHAEFNAKAFGGTSKRSFWSNSMETKNNSTERLRRDTLGQWTNTSANVTSLRIDFGGATCTDGYAILRKKTVSMR